MADPTVYKTSYTTTGKQTVTLKVECSDDSSKYTTTSCDVNVTDSTDGGNGYNPIPTYPIKSGDLAATCSCTSSGCNVNITGGSSDYNAYTCT